MVYDYKQLTMYFTLEDCNITFKEDPNLTKSRVSLRFVEWTLTQDTKVCIELYHMAFPHPEIICHPKKSIYFQMSNKLTLGTPTISLSCHKLVLLLPPYIIDLSTYFLDGIYYLIFLDVKIMIKWMLIDFILTINLVV